MENLGRRAAYADGGNILLRRWAGAWIDFIALGLILFATGLVLGNQTGVVVIVAVVVAAFGYFTLSEGIWGRSLGKLVTGTVVVDAAGNPPGVLRAFVRTLLRLIEVNPFLLGGMPAGLSVWLTRGNQRLGDLAAGTYVVTQRQMEAARTKASSPSVFD